MVRLCPDRIDQPVCTRLFRFINIDINPQIHTVITDQQRHMSGCAGHRIANNCTQCRHHAGNNRTGDRSTSVCPQKVTNSCCVIRTILVCIGFQTPDRRAVLKQVPAHLGARKNDIGIADINC
jgi:hypothetical protein